jgi:hypothetical protein
MLPTLLLAFVLSVLTAVLAAARGSQLTFALAVILFALQVLVVLLRFNVPLWRQGAEPENAEWAWDNSVLTAIAYAWGAMVMFTAYSLGGLVWRHWWQYGAGMLMLGAGALLVASYLIGARASHASDRTLDALMRATTLHAAAVVAALVYLLTSGKLATVKDDWAANQVFLTGGTVVIVISLVSLLTWRFSQKRSA